MPSVDWELKRDGRCRSPDSFWLCSVVVFFRVHHLRCAAIYSSRSNPYTTVNRHKKHLLAVKLGKVRDEEENRPKEKKILFFFLGGAHTFFFRNFSVKKKKGPSSFSNSGHLFSRVFSFWFMNDTSFFKVWNLIKLGAYDSSSLGEPFAVLAFLFFFLTTNQVNEVEAPSSLVVEMWQNKKNARDGLVSCPPFNEIVSAVKSRSNGWRSVSLRFMAFTTIVRLLSTNPARSDTEKKEINIKKKKRNNVQGGKEGQRGHEIFMEARRGAHPSPARLRLEEWACFSPKPKRTFSCLFKKNRQQNVRRRCRTVAVYRQTCLTEEDPSSFGGSGSACTVSFLFADFSFYFFYYPLPLIFCDTRTRKEEKKSLFSS